MTADRRTFVVPALDAPLPEELVRELEALAASVEATAVSADLLLTRLEAEASVSERWGRPLSLVLVRVEDMDGVAASFGEEATAAAFEHLGARLRRAVRASDSVGYWSADELALVLPGCFAEGVQAVAKRLRSVLAGDPARVVRGRRKKALRLRFGGAAWSSRIASTDELCAAAALSLLDDSVGRDL
ncbi:MAG: diguanylate cyclase domain-containing protein [Gaiellaceae bacterium]